MEERLAGRDLQRLRVAIPGRATLHDVADVHVLTPPADGLDHLREQLARAADEWPAALVLFLARALADEDDAGVGASLAEDHAAPLLAERTAPAVADLGADRVEQRQLGDGRGRGAAAAFGGARGAPPRPPPLARPVPLPGPGPPPPAPPRHNRAAAREARRLLEAGRVTALAVGVLRLVLVLERGEGGGVRGLRPQLVLLRVTARAGRGADELTRLEEHPLALGALLDQLAPLVDGEGPELAVRGVRDQRQALPPQQKQRGGPGAAAPGGLFAG